MTHVVFHRNKTLLGACSIAAMMMFSQTALAHGGAVGSAMGGGMRAAPMQQAHPIDPSGHLNNFSAAGNGSAPRAAPVTGTRLSAPISRPTPVPESPQPVVERAGQSVSTPHPVAEQSQPVAERAGRSISTPRPVAEHTQPSADPVRHLVTPGQNPE